MKRSKHTAALDQFSLFAGLPAGLLDRLQKAAIVYTLSHREALFNQGDISHAIYLIAEGGLQLVEQTNGGQEVKLKVHSSGEMLGLLAISGCYPYPSRAEAVGESVIVGIPGESVRAAMHLYPELALRVIDNLVAHVHHAHGRMRHMMVERAEQRIARALIHYCEKFGIRRDDYNAGISIEVTLSQQDIAQFTGATVETVNRTLKAWENNNWLRLSRQHVDVLDLSALVGVAEDRVFA